jgi:hypothetical protein
MSNRTAAPQPSNVGFTSKARRVGTLLFRARSSQVTGVHTQNKVMQQQNRESIEINNNTCLLIVMMQRSTARQVESWEK